MNLTITTPEIVIPATTHEITTNNPSELYNVVRSIAKDVAAKTLHKLKNATVLVHSNKELRYLS